MVASFAQVPFGMKQLLCSFLVSGILLSGLYEVRFGYIFGAAAILLTAIAVLLRTPILPVNSKASIFVFLLPFFVFLSWCYGLFLGIYNGNNISYVFSNFAGLSLYLMFYFFWAFSYEVKFFYRVLLACAVICSLWGLVNWALFVGAQPQAEGFSGGRVYISATLLYGVTFCSVYLFSRFFPGDQNRLLYSEANKIGFFLVAFFLVALILPARSKGFLLSVFLIVSLCMFFLTIDVALRGRFKVVALLPFSCAAIAGFFLLYYYDYFYQSFSLDNVSNRIRSEQFEYLKAEIKFMGSGLGAVLESGYARDDTGYGFELTYVNIVHKLGVFSFILFLSYAVTALYALRFIFNPKLRIYGGFIIGLISFLVPGAGNPMLLSPAMVLLHSAALYYIYSYISGKNTEVG